MFRIPFRSAGRAAVLLPAVVLGLSLAGQPSVAGECPQFESKSEGLPTKGEWRTHPALADVNADGRLDIAGYPRKGRGPQVWLANGKGFKPASTGLKVPGFSCGVGVELADVNSDGHLDLGVADHCSGFFLYLGDGEGGWRLGHSEMRGSRQGFEDLAFGDLDGDGMLDLLTLGSFRGGLSVFKGDGTGRFKRLPASATGLPDAGYGAEVRLADLNGDGTPDVLASYSGGIWNPPVAELHRNFLWLSQGPGKFEAASRGVFEDGRSYGVASGDVNEDGIPDIALARNTGPPLRVLLRDKEGGYQTSVEGLPVYGKTRYYGIELADIDGDGHLDLAAADHMRGNLELYLGDGKGGWKACPDAGLPGTRPNDIRAWGLSVGDLTGDGRPDIVVGFGRNQAGSVEVWAQKGR